MSLDGTPDWAYDEDHYCVCCGNGDWNHHMPECQLRDALDAADVTHPEPERLRSEAGLTGRTDYVVTAKRKRKLRGMLLASFVQLIERQPTDQELDDLVAAYSRIAAPVEHSPLRETQIIQDLFTPP